MQTNLKYYYTKILRLFEIQASYKQADFWPKWVFLPVWRGAGPQKSVVSYMILVHTSFFITKDCTVGMD